MRRTGLGLLAGCVVICSCGAREDVGSAGAGVATAPASPEQARALRRKLRDERPLALAAFATAKKVSSPFAVANDAPTFAPTLTAFTASQPAIETPKPPSSPRAFLLPSLLPSPIAPMPDRSGRYVMRRRDSATFFTPRGFAFSLSSPLTRDKDRDPSSTPSALGGNGWGLHCTLVGARDGALLAEDEQHARVHHYVSARASSSGGTDVPTYRRLAWEEIYAGVDMVAEPGRDGVAYRFVLSPGAKVSDLVMRWEGATAVRVVESGRGVDVETGIGVLRVRGLRAFAIEGEQRIELPARHVVRDSSQMDVALEVDGWNGREPLVIDPTIAWSSYLGGAVSDSGQGRA